MMEKLGRCERNRHLPDKSLGMSVFSLLDPSCVMSSLLCPSPTFLLGLMLYSVYSRLTAPTAGLEAGSHPPSTSPSRCWTRLKKG